MQDPGRPQYADSGSDAQSFDEAESNDAFVHAYRSFHRNVTTYPPADLPYPPEALRVARTGPSAGYPVVYRLDRETLYRLDSRPPDVIFQEGFTGYNDHLPVSLQDYQKSSPYTRFVSTTRDPRVDPELFREILASVDPTPGGLWLYKISIRGGIDVLASLGPAAYSHQQEVLIPDRVGPEYVDTATPFDRDSRQCGATVGNPNAWGTVQVRRERDFERAQVATRAMARLAPPPAPWPRPTPPIPHPAQPMSYQPHPILFRSPPRTLPGAMPPAPAGPYPSAAQPPYGPQGPHRPPGQLGRPPGPGHQR
ncbi:hypothetical protein ABT336_03425 [Micromonospora sp. NPDC000207]|uniref:scabin-related ADP-ribosyltransferase n=1 Tax=Micromonospora sp. NPDC000207 TaxID=3154246 RepID=UPI0033230225